MQRQQGTTLLELLVVLAIMGLAVAGVSLVFRDSAQTQLERDAQRLIAKLEAARAQSRTSGKTMVWRALPDGYVIETLPQGGNLAPAVEHWYQEGTLATVQHARGGLPNNWVVLGPEPILSPTQIQLNVQGDRQNPFRLTVGTQGLAPFEVLP